MINYEKYMSDENFVDILECLRNNIIYSESEVCDALDMDPEIVEKYYFIAQAAVAEEIEHGEIHDPLGAYIAYKYIDNILDDYEEDDDYDEDE